MKIIFFDGYCSLCNGFVDWGLRHDTKRIVQFASLQGKTAQKYIPAVSGSSDLDTVIYYRDGKVLERSEAVLYFLKDLGGWTSVVSLFLVVPEGIRNFFYKLIAKNRYVFLKNENHAGFLQRQKKTIF